MKKTALILLVSIFMWSCATSKSLDYPEPPFEKPFAYVIDAFQSEGSIKDNVVLHNYSRDSNIRFQVYVHNPDNAEWLVYGTGILKGAGDWDTIDPHNINGYRYFAIESLDSKNYTYQYYKKHNDLHITILDL